MAEMVAESAGVPMPAIVGKSSGGTADVGSPDAGLAAKMDNLLGDDAPVASGVQADFRTAVDKINSLPTTSVDFVRDISGEMTKNAEKFDEILQKTTMHRQARETDAAAQFDSLIPNIKQQLKDVCDLVENVRKKGGDVSQADLIHIQFKITQMGIVLDISSKSADKASTMLQTLFKG
jgi:hypothetical protein